MKNILFIVLISFVIFSCKSTKKISEQFDESDLLPFHNNDLTSLKIEGNMDVSMPDNEASASMEVNILKLDEMKMNIFGPFGIEVAQMYSNQDKFIFFNMFKGEAYQGKPSSENLNKVANISLSFSDLISIMRCEIPSNGKKFKRIKEIDSIRIFQNITSKDNIELVHINKYGNLIKYELKELDGIVIFNVDFNDYRTINEFKLAYNVKVNFPKIAGYLELEIENYTTNFDLNNLQLNLPKSVKVKDIE